MINKIKAQFITENEDYEKGYGYKSGNAENRNRLCQPDIACRIPYSYNVFYFSRKFPAHKSPGDKDPDKKNVESKTHPYKQGIIEIRQDYCLYSLIIYRQQLRQETAQQEQQGNDE